MQHKLDLDRSYFPHSHQIYEWCKANVGKNPWEPGCNWNINQVFGTTHMEFEHQQDLLNFTNWLNALR